VEENKGGVIITVEDQRITQSKKQYKIQCKKLIICPGAWLTPTMKNMFNIAVPSQVLQMGYHYFNVVGNDKSVYHASKFPVFVDYSTTDVHIYGTPAYEYPGLLKIGTHGTGISSCQTTAETRSFSMIPELLQHTQQKAKMFFPLLDWKNPAFSETCLYTWTKDAQFLLDFVPDHPNVIVGGGGSGHAFKHGAAIGEVLADMALGIRSSLLVPEYSFDYHTMASRI